MAGSYRIGFTPHVITDECREINTILYFLIICLDASLLFYNNLRGL